MKNLSSKFETMQFIVVLGKVPISSNVSAARLRNYKPTNLLPYNKNFSIYTVRQEWDNTL